MRALDFSLFFVNVAKTHRRQTVRGVVTGARERGKTSLREYEKLEMPTKTGSTYSRGNESTMSFLCTRDEDHNARAIRPERVYLRAHTRVVLGASARCGHVCSLRWARVNVPPI